MTDVLSAADAPSTDPIAWTDAARAEAFTRWLAPLIASDGLDPASLRSASSDASFRRYFRIDRRADAADGAVSRIVMDAPPPHEAVGPFVHVARLAAAAGIAVPRVLAEDAGHGFLLLSDLGPTRLLDALAEQLAADQVDAAARRMRAVGSLLVEWQLGVEGASLPPFDDALLRRELALFPEWCVEREYGVHWTPEEDAVWHGACDLLVQSALAQPTVAVHRDFMPRNLMAVPDGRLGVLDFQDAVRGPITYDAASMLRDAFLSWDEEIEIDLAVRYWEAARKAQLPVDADFGEFWRQLEWMGLQRHLKVLGIFCRLKHRDSKPDYSRDLPRFFTYVHRVATRYRGFGPLALLVEPLMGVERVDAFR